MRALFKSMAVMPMLALVLSILCSGSYAFTVKGVVDFSEYEKVTKLSDTELVAKLNDIDPIMRSSVITEIGNRKLKSAIPQLQEMLNDKNKSVWVEAAIVLLDMGNKSGVYVLHLALNTCPRSIALKAAYALARNGDESGLALAKSELKNPQGDRLMAMNTLSYAKDEETAYSALKAGLEDEKLRPFAIELLGKRGEKRALNILAGLNCTADKDELNLKTKESLATLAVVTNLTNNEIAKLAVGQILDLGSGDAAKKKGACNVCRQLLSIYWWSGWFPMLVPPAS